MPAEKIIPDDVKLAATRGFVRTTAQAYATALAGGIATNAVLAIVNGEVDTATIVTTAIVAVLSPLLAGAASYLSITAKGVPGEYAPSAVEVVQDPEAITPADSPTAAEELDLDPDVDDLLGADDGDQDAKV